MRKKHTTSLLIIVIIGILVLALVFKFLTGMLNKQTEEKPNTMPSPTAENSTAVPVESPIKTYQNNKFSFNYNEQLQMKESSSSGISWWEPNGKFWMELSWQNSPFPKFPEVSANSDEVRIDKDKEITVSRNKVRDLVYGCGTDCYFHELQIQTDDQFYRLKASIAPEGQLEGKFQQVITSIKFTQ